LSTEVASTSVLRVQRLSVVPARPTRRRCNAAALRRTCPAYLRATRLATASPHGPTRTSPTLTSVQLCTLLRRQHGAHFFAGFHCGDTLCIARRTGLVETGAQRGRITAGPRVYHVSAQSQSF
jgi:hypothetical protein